MLCSCSSLRGWRRIPSVSHLLGLVVVTSNDTEVVRHGTTALIRQSSRGVVCHPAVNSSPTGVDPEDVLETEVLPQPDIHNLHLRHSVDTNQTRSCLSSVLGWRCLAPSEHFPIFRGSNSKVECERPTRGAHLLSQAGEQS